MPKRDVTDVDGLVMQDVDVPEPGPGQVRVKVEVVSLTSGQRVMTTGTGSVSLFAMQLARAAGATVSAISGSADGRERLVDLGVTPVVDRVATPAWGQAVLEATGGVHEVVDTIGTGTANESLTACAYGGEVATVGLMDMERFSLERAREALRAQASHAAFGKIVIEP